MAVRLIHFSDVHLTAEPLGWRDRDWFSKRVTGWINWHWCGRGQRFRRADEIVALLTADIMRRRPDRVIFSGDATALGFETELARAAALLGVHEPAMPAGLAVPGNHDHYTQEAAASGLFERYFRPWLRGERIDDQPYPFAQQVGPLWLIGVNSCIGGRWPWDARGAVGAEQLARLDRLLRQLPVGPRFLVTHYPVCRADGRPEPPYRSLRDLDDLLAVARTGQVALWLHGHRHEPFHRCRHDGVPFPVIGAGSATQEGLWSHGEYVVDGCRLRGVRRVYQPESRAFADVETFELELALP
ncbi:MAG: metallophosphoesterase [Gemmataceae bacterium]|nr:metallophosphoesterase [Gemmataceae bacterium]MDW8266073.1 metallophosphoesterase [Gemmataceae bacterium]